MKRNWIIVGAVAAMLAGASAGAGAQTTPDTTAPGATAPSTTTPNTAPTPDTTTPGTDTTTNPGTLSTGTSTTLGSMSTPMSPGTGMSNGTPDYSLLSDQSLNYSMLKGARAKGLSDRQVATVAKIAEMTGASFTSITDAVLRGETFSMLANDYNLRLSDVLNVDDEMTKISNYEAAYETTGEMALKNSGTTDSSMPMSSTSTSSTTTTTSMTSMAPTKDIVDTAMSDRRFRTLVRLLKKENLVDALKGPGPFTVFAPTDAAFRKLPKNTLKNLTDDQLSAILKYHVLPAKVDAATAMAMTSPTSPATLEGSTLQVTTQNGTVMVNDAKVVQADIQATNGIIHAIDTVLMPPDMPASPTGTTGTTDTTGTTGAGATGANAPGTTDTTGANTPDTMGNTTPPPAPGTTTDTTPAAPATGTDTTPAAPAAPAAGQ